MIMVKMEYCLKITLRIIKDEYKYFTIDGHFGIQKTDDDRRDYIGKIHSIDGNILSKVINLIYFLDYTSIYKSVLSNVDPTPVEPIEFIKNKL